jgi:hypothetical protein
VALVRTVNAYKDAVRIKRHIHVTKPVDGAEVEWTMTWTLLVVVQFLFTRSLYHNLMHSVY